MQERDPLNLHVDALTNRLHPEAPFTVSGPHDLEALRSQWAKLDSIPLMFANRDQGVDHGWLGLDVRTLLAGENSSGRQSVHDIILAPEAGLPPHVHDIGDTYWYVVAGEVEMTIGSVSASVGRGGFGYAPSETTQAIRNLGPEPAHVLLVYFPAGAGRAFSEAHALWTTSGSSEVGDYLAVLERYGFRFGLTGPQKNDARTNAAVERLEATIETSDDFEALRGAWRQRPPVPKLVQGLAEAGRRHARGSVTGNVLVSGDEDSGRAVFLSGEIQARHRAPTHHQPAEEEMFFILEGEIMLTCGTETAVVGPGGFSFAPRHTTHGYNNPSDGISRMVTCNSPAGHERGFEMMVRERANPSEKFQDLVVAHGWRMHRQIDVDGKPVNAA